MPLTPSQAADIAKRHGLTLTDAAGLLGLADTAAEADTIAARFATGTTSESVGAEYVRQLFGRDDAEHGADDNDEPDDADDPLRRFTRDLFPSKTD